MTIFKNYLDREILSLETPSVVDVDWSGAAGTYTVLPSTDVIKVAVTDFDPNDGANATVTLSNGVEGQHILIYTLPSNLFPILMVPFTPMSPDSKQAFDFLEGAWR